MTVHRLTAVALGAAVSLVPAADALGAKSKKLAPKSGKVVISGGVKVKGKKLEKAKLLATGTTIDATTGTAKIAALVNGKRVNASVSKGAFKVSQSGRKGALTITPSGGGLTCKAPYGKATAKRSLTVSGDAGVVVKGCFATSTVTRKGALTVSETPGKTSVASRSAAVKVTAGGQSKTLAAGGSTTAGPTGFPAPAPAPAPVPLPAPVNAPLPVPVLPQPVDQLGAEDTAYYLIQFDADTTSSPTLGATRREVMVYKNTDQGRGYAQFRDPQRLFPDAPVDGTAIGYIRLRCRYKKPGMDAITTEQFELNALFSNADYGRSWNHQVTVNPPNLSQTSYSYSLSVGGRLASGFVEIQYDDGRTDDNARLCSGKRYFRTVGYEDGALGDS